MLECNPDPLHKWAEAATEKSYIRIPRVEVGGFESIAGATEMILFSRIHGKLRRESLEGA